MASMPELRNQARGLVKKLDDVTNDAEMSIADRKTAIEALEEESKSVTAQIENSERASELRSKLEAGGEVKDVETGKRIVKYDRPNLFSPARMRAVAMEAVQRPEFQAIFGQKDSRRQINTDLLSLGTKYSIDTGDDLSGNVMGEGLYGANGPDAIGQNPFGYGAWAQGIMPDWRPGIVEQLFYELTIPDLISEFSTSSDNLSYLTESAINLQANQTAEAATYPFSSVLVARQYAEIAKIANAMTVTDEAIADAATLFSFVQGRLLLSLRRQEEVQLLAAQGNPGVGGLLNFASNFTASSSGSIFGATSATGSSIAFPPSGTYGAGTPSQTITSLAYGRVVTGSGTSYPSPAEVALNLKDAATDIELAVFHSPSAHIMHPRDWQRLETAQDATGQFMNTNFFGFNYGQRANGGKTLWGVPVVTTPLFPVGTILTGWFDSQTVQAARRQGVNMQMTNSNASDFVEGLVTVRADSRLGLLCYRPTAFQLTQLVAG